MAKSQKKKNQAAVRSHEAIPAQPEAVTPLALPPAPPPPPIEQDHDGDGHASPPLALPAGEPRAALPALTLTPRTLINTLSLEAGLYILIFIAALLMRFSGLGARPLAEHEAAVANAAWQFLQGAPNGFVGSPFLFSTNLMLFFLGGPTDATVRVFPALIGSALVLLPALLRREIGRTGALASSILLLLSTTLVFFSRDSGGAEIAVATGLGAAIAVWRYSETQKAGYLYWGLAASAIALTASSVAFTLLSAGVVFAVLFRRLDARVEVPSRLLEEYSDGPTVEHFTTDDRRLRVEWRNGIILFVLVYVGIATAFMANREGLGAAFDLFGKWLGGLAGLGPFTSPLNLLPIYEPVSLVFGFAGLLLLTSLRGEELRSRAILLFFVFVLIVGIIFYSISGAKDSENVVVLVVPLAILAGWLIGSLLERFVLDIQNLAGWRVATLGELPVLAFALALTALIYLQLVNLLQQNRFSPNIETLRDLISPTVTPGQFETALILLGVFAFLIGTLILVLAIGTMGATRAANLGSLIVIVLLGISGVHAMWLANYTTPEPVNELLAGQQTSLQARDLVRDLEWLSEWRDSDPHVVPIRADESLSAVVHWYLRPFKNIKWVRQPEADAVAEAILTAADAPPPAGTWIEQRYRIQTQWEPANLAGDLFWKWLLFRDGGVQDWQYVKFWAPKPE